ncbi:peptide chain release factor family protein [Crateriforma spongiae]|uniref:peptide chain release factor family protein n=1 Tax=Crateriforma spongiae TaxID=2724528 RepID=UPI001446BF22|nr:peptide chain release factor-like protein [Crateriforma spongiae]
MSRDDTDDSNTTDVRHGNRDGDDHSAKRPNADERYPATVVPHPHPAAIDEDELLRQCDRRAQRRSGPGGQHRNKTSTGIFWTHRPTGHIGEATERRSQVDNQREAFQRLRMKLAIAVRTDPRSVDGPRAQDSVARRWRDQYAGSPLRIASSNANLAAVIAVLLDDLWDAGGQPSLVADDWNVSTSAIVRLLRGQPAALQLVNQIRQHHGRKPLR